MAGRRARRRRSEVLLKPVCSSLLLLSLRVSAADDVVTLNYPGSAKAGELACEANYYLWLPLDVKTVRGFIAHQHGCGDGAERGCLAAEEDLRWRALAEKWDCALPGTTVSAAREAVAKLPPPSLVVIRHLLGDCVGR